MKTIDLMRLFTLLLLSGPAWAQLAISTTDPAAVAGGTLNLAATGGTAPYTWSLSAGSVGSIVSGTGVYTAPATVTVNHQAAGCQVYPSSSIFSTKISNLPVHASNAAWMAVLDPIKRITLAPNYGLNIVTNSTPLFEVISQYTATADGDYPILPFPWLKRQGGYYSHPQSGLDRHIANVNKETCEFTEMYNTYTAGINAACPTCTAQSAARYDGKKFKFQAGSGVDAAGLPLQPVTLKLADFNDGVIKHPMRITLENTQIDNTYIWPATANAVIPSGIIPYGAWFRLKSSFNITGFSAKAQIILQAWKDYGFLVADGTDVPYEVTSDGDISQDKDVFAAIDELKLSPGPQIPDFEFVDVCPTPGTVDCLKVSDTTTEVRHDNSYETPVDYAHACVTDAVAATACKYIALQGVTVGTSYTAMTFQAGADPVQLDSWVHGSANQSVTWSIIGTSTGSLTSGGEYTPPATVASPTTTMFEGVAAADANAKVRIYVVVWPEGVIRVDSARTTDYVGSEGTWFKEHGFDGGQGDSTVQTSQWPATTDITLHHTQRFVRSADMLHRWWLSPGNYKVTLKMGFWSSTGSAWYNSGIIPPYNYMMGVDSNGTVIKRRYDFGLAAVNWNTPVDLEIPCWVQASDNGLCFFSLRKIADRKLDTSPDKAWCAPSGIPQSTSTGACAVNINALRIEPDTGGERIEIDGDTSDITITKTRQLGCVGWFIESTCTWAIVSGPGSIDANGLYTAPSTPPTSGSQAVTIRATHTVDTMLTDDIVFNFAFGTIVVSTPVSGVYRGQTAQFTAAIGGVDYSAGVTWSDSGQGSLNSSGLYSAPGSVSPDETLTITATSIHDVSKSGTAQLDLSQLRPTIYLNASTYPYTVQGVESVDGVQKVDGAGWQWQNDALGSSTTVSPTGAPWSFTSGTSSQNGTFATAITHGPGCDANDATDRKQIYHALRYRSAGSWSYTFTLPNGSWHLRFKFMTPNDTSNYTQDISVQGVLWQDNLVTTTLTGGAYYCADLETTATVTNGTLTVTFAPAAGGTTLISGIVLTDLGPLPINSSISGRAATTGKVTQQE